MTEFLNGISAITIKAIGLASDPVSPIDGQIWYNTTTGKFRVHENGTTKNMVVVGGGGGGSITIEEVLVDFGSTPSAAKEFNITVSGVTAGQKVLVTPSLKAPVGMDYDELEMDPIFCFGHVYVDDTVKLLVGPQSPIARLTGQRYLNITIG